MAAETPGEINDLLRAWQGGDRAALDRLMPLVQSELRRAARTALRRERPGHSLQPTALINEAYLRLVDQRSAGLNDRAHFVGLAAEMMRRVLVDHARARAAQKRGGGAERVSLGRAMDRPSERTVDLLCLDEALLRLARLDSRQARVVELRFFGGLSVDETACLLGVSSATVKRDWATARAWLYRELDER